MSKIKKTSCDASTSHESSKNNLSSLVYQKEEENPIKSDWEKPLPLEEIKQIEFPNNIFPEWLDSYVKAVAEETQTPIDAPAFAALATLSTVLNKKYEIKIWGSWKEYLNLYLTLALDSGNRKSGVFNHFTKVIYDYQEEKRQELFSKVIKENAIIKAKEKLLKNKENNYANKPDEITLKEIKALSNEIAKLKSERTILPKIIASDATPEKLAMIMNEQDEKIALLSAEGAEVFEMIAGRYGEKPNQDLYLKSFNAEAFDVERVSREAIHLRSPSIVIGLFVQSSVIQDIPQEFTNRGLTQRFLYSFPTSYLGYRDVRPETMKKDLIKKYEKSIKTLLEFEIKSNEPLLLSDEAIDLLEEQMKEIELMLRNKNMNIGMVGWLSKLTGNIVRIAGLLHIADAVDDLESMPKVISKTTLKKAFILKEYLICHAERAFGIMGVDERIEDLKYLLDVIKEKSINKKSLELTYREVFESTKRSFKSATVFKRKLRELEEMYWIKNYKNGKQYISLNPYTDKI